MLGFFQDWAKVTGTFEEKSVSKNSVGQPVESWSEVVSDETWTVQFWTDTSNETNTNDKFVNERKGSMLVSYNDLSFTPTTDMRFKVGSDHYYITGVDNVAKFNVFYVLNWRYDHGA